MGIYVKLIKCYTNLQGKNIMISIIICSRNADIKQELKANIKETIGDVSYELVVIDNSQCKYSIFQAYNQGVQCAQYPVLCFIHEDVVFMSKDWGDKICQSFQNRAVGLLGVIGGHYMGNFSRSWGDSGLISGQVIQGGRKGHAVKIVHDEYRYLNGDVVAVDGLFLASKKILFDNGTLSWDETSYEGFHFYDMDISMQVLKAGLSIKIIDGLLIQHNSCSFYNDSFYQNYKIFYTKWGNIFPVISPLVSPELQRTAYLNVLESHVQQGTRLSHCNKLMKCFPYKIATKIRLLLGCDVW